jgi:nucleoid DNA-binding protein
MNELVTLVAQRTGLSQEDAQKAVVEVINILKTKLPAPIASHLDSLMTGGLGALEAEAGDMVKGKLSGMFGGTKAT